MTPLERISYTPITNRPPLKLPNGARMVVRTIVNIEEWDINQSMPRAVLTPPAAGAPVPGAANALERCQTRRIECPPHHPGGDS